MRALCIFCITAMLALVVSLAGCSSKDPATVAVPNLPQSMAVNPPPGSLLLTYNTYAGDALHKMLLLRMGSGGGILTTSFVDIHDMNRTSAFGRVSAQQVGSRLGQYGFRVIEARLANSMSMTPGPGNNAGEFMLTRETARLLADTYDANAVLVGCYSDYGNTIFVSARVVRLSDNTVMGAYEYYVPRDADVSLLLSGSASNGRGGSIAGDGIWNHYNAREQAFAPGSHGPREGAFHSPGTSRSGAAARKSSAKSPSLAGQSGAAGGAGGTVPRYVAPVPKAAEASKPKAQKAPAAVAKKAAPAPAATPAPVTPEKDAPAPAGTPGGEAS
ncbi:MAG: hypothetical protein DELT_01901 [Desulfovibrio sp.]